VPPRDGRKAAIKKIPAQGCQMVLFSDQKSQFWYIFFGALDWKMLIYVMAIWNISWTFGKFYDHSVRFVLIVYIFSGFGITFQR
jgi:hypothetical protein